MRRVGQICECVPLISKCDILHQRRTMTQASQASPQAAQDVTKKEEVGDVEECNQMHKVPVVEVKTGNGSTASITQERFS